MNIQDFKNKVFDAYRAEMLKEVRTENKVLSFFEENFLIQFLSGIILTAAVVTPLLNISILLGGPAFILGAMATMSAMTSPNKKIVEKLEQKLEEGFKDRTLVRRYKNEHMPKVENLPTGADLKKQINGKVQKTIADFNKNAAAVRAENDMVNKVLAVKYQPVV